MGVYAIVNRKGGTAKTSTAVNLAHGLTLKLSANGGGRVLLIDLDPQGNCAPALGIDPAGRCVSDLLTGKRMVRDVIIPDIDRNQGGTGRPGLFLIPASDKLVDATEELLIRDFQNYRRQRNAAPITEILSAQLKSVRNAFNFVIIDCPPSLGSLTEAVYHFADKAIVPVRPALLDTTGAAQHTRMINEMQQQGLDIKVSLIVPTFYSKRQVLAGKVLTALKSRYGASRVAEPIPQSVVVQKAQAAGGQTLFEYEPAKEHKVTVAYQKLVERVYHDR